MRKNETLEKALQELKETGDTWASWDVLRGYKESRENGNMWLNLHTINGDCGEIIVGR